MLKTCTSEWTDLRRKSCWLVHYTRRRKTELGGGRVYLNFIVIACKRKERMSHDKQEWH